MDLLRQLADCFPPPSLRSLFQPFSKVANIEEIIIFTKERKGKLVENGGMAYLGDKQYSNYSGIYIPARTFAR